MIGNLHEDLCRFSCPRWHKIAIKAFLTVKCSAMLQKKCKNITFFTDRRLLERAIIYCYKFNSYPVACNVTSFLAFSVVFLSIKMKIKINELFKESQMKVQKNFVFGWTFFFPLPYFKALSQNCEKRLLASSCLSDCLSVRLPFHIEQSATLDGF
jgi:hypothetical protein